MSDVTSGSAASRFDPRAREQQILGKPPRIEPLDAAEISEEGRQILNNVLEAAKLPPSADIPEAVATLLRYPELFQKTFDVGLLLLGRGVLTPRDREIAVLRIGWLLGAPYEWGEHVRIGKLVGLTGEDIERIVEGSTAAGWSERDRVILRAVEELLDDAMISDETWAVLERQLDEKQLIELPVLVGNYQTIAYYQNSFRMRLTKDNPGLSAR